MGLLCSCLVGALPDPLYVIRTSPCVGGGVAMLGTLAANGRFSSGFGGVFGRLESHAITGSPTRPFFVVPSCA